MPVTPDQAQAVLAEADCLFTEAQVEQALDAMAQQITDKLGASNPIVMCVMNGGLVPTGKLVTRLRFPLQMDYLHATRYRNTTSGGDLTWLARPHTDIRGRPVLVVDDILDEGITLAAIMNYCREQGAEAVYSAVLVDKRHERKHGLQEADFVGLEVEDRYVFGYGMDYKGFLRNAAGIYAVRGS